MMQETGGYQGGTAGEQTLVGLFERPAQVETARNLLAAEGVPPERLAVLRSQDLGVFETPGEARHQEAAKQNTAMATGAAVGTFFGSIFGPFFPIGTVAGGLVGALVGLGLPREAALRYRERVGAGGELLLVRAAPDEVAMVRRVLGQAEAELPPDELVRAVEAKIGAPAEAVTPEPPAVDERAVGGPTLDPEMRYSRPAPEDTRAGRITPA